MDKQEGVKIKPTILRLFISNIILVLIILLVIIICIFAIGGSFDLLRTLEEYSILYVFIVVAYTFVDYVRSDKKTIVITSEGLLGPSGKKYNEIEFIEYNNFDKEKTNKQNLYQKILGYRYVYSITGAIIVITPELYSNKDRKLIMERIDLEE
jgi:hypothetical protein